ncbi:YdiU family protein [Metabacillus litoralis]|uniref:Protein nucleotidyltransferase YdiU n=1 Tax=Metabacillus litoralis TaxID=152268 RepID=A0A5C6VKS1_9BACI|nr:YdiU family protein [Metabacillus litoralis]TXC85650.1 YdiU family protein [Metabacillus litoralis]
MTNSKESNQIGWNIDNSYARLPQSFYTIQDLNPVSSPEMIILNHELAKTLGLNAKELQSKETLSMFAGNKELEDAKPLAQAYAGHQFGHFNMLGDGRALLLGEQITPKGETVDIQLKGSGRTKYSRGGDGRAAIGPMLREYIISEAMYALGIPTTRSLAVVATGEKIRRETELPGAILTRIASSHLRVGTFEYATNFTTIEELKDLADYTIKRHYPEIASDENKYLSLLNEVIKRQAALIAKWQLVGFIHGVMNTDNVTISGETIDYGPCAFMNEYDPATVFSSIDVQGRYAYGNQPKIGGWNLARFAEALIPILDEDEEKALKLAQDAVLEFPKLYHSNWLTGMRAKLGLFTEEAEDESLIENLLEIMKNNRADFTNTFRALSHDKSEDSNVDMFNTPEFSEWHQKWHERLCKQEESLEQTYELMKSSNPAVIPRNHRVEEALKAAVENEDYSVMENLLEILSNPYKDTMEPSYCSLPPESSGPYRTYCGT